MKLTRLAFMVICLTSLAGSCIFDYIPATEKGEKDVVLVVRGDILIGEETTVSITYMSGIGAASTGCQLVDAVYVESSEGTQYRGEADNSHIYHIDTRPAVENAEYRLVIETAGKVYESDWQPVLQAAAIDSISFSISDDASTMTIEVSSSGSPESDHRYYRWIARQTWKYHAASRPVHYYVPPGEVTLDGMVSPSGGIYSYPLDVEDLYFCWKSAEVSDLLLGSTSHYSENRFIRHALYTMDCHDMRTQYLYSVQLIQEAIPEDAWRYYEAVRRNSSDVGGLFSPQPTEVHGNLHNRTNPGEWVIGYVCVTRPAVHRHFIDMRNLGFHKINRSWETFEDFKVDSQYWEDYWRAGYLVSRVEEVVFWASKRCLDCRAQGGTKDRPDWWQD